MQGLQYETVNLGPPKPPCNQDRLATLRALDCTDGPSNPEIGPFVLSFSTLAASRHVAALSVSSLSANVGLCNEYIQCKGPPDMGTDQSRMLDMHG